VTVVPSRSVDQPAVRHLEVTAWDEEGSVRPDAVAVEEPLEIRLAGCSVAVTMRTPGDDLDLAAGFLYTEGILRSAHDIATIAPCPTDDPGAEGNAVNVNPTDPAIVDPERWHRNFFVTSSCGVCGKASIETVRQDAPPIASGVRVTPRVLYRMAETLRASQRLFEETGGLHAAGLFTAGGTKILVREDVGRHNAVDKVIGWALREHRLPLNDHVLMVSGRASFEVVQKALMAGVPVVAAVSAPSSLAVDLARDANMTLVGFLRTRNGAGRLNVYTGTERIAASSEDEA
jgi:FdhD protein